MLGKIEVGSCPLGRDNVLDRHQRLETIDEFERRVTRSHLVGRSVGEQHRIQLYVPIGTVVIYQLLKHGDYDFVG